jgi:predicted acetyltransferase
MSETKVERAHGSAVERAALEQLMQFYIYDFVEFLAPERRMHLGEDGRFPAHPQLDSYWTEPGSSVWFVRSRGVLCGFALLNKHAHTGQPVDVNVGEYFVARPYRRAGLGTDAITQLLAAQPGLWEIAISARNVPAQAFWPRAIANTAISDLQTLQGDGVHWTGPILRFRGPQH